MAASISQGFKTFLKVIERVNSDFTLIPRLLVTRQQVKAFKKVDLDIYILKGVEKQTMISRSKVFRITSEEEEDNAIMELEEEVMEELIKYYINQAKHNETI